MENRRLPAKGKALPAEYFDWSLTQALRHLVDVHKLSNDEAAAELERAIGAGELPYMVFAVVDGKLQCGKVGRADFWRSDVTLRLIKHDTEGNEIEPEVHVWPSHIGFGVGLGNFAERVPSQLVEDLYRKRSGPQLIALSQLKKKDLKTAIDEELKKRRSLGHAWDGKNTRSLAIELKPILRKMGLDRNVDTIRNVLGKFRK